jgi:hypothetical protein
VPLYAWGPEGPQGVTTSNGCLIKTGHFSRLLVPRGRRIENPRAPQINTDNQPALDPWIDGLPNGDKRQRTQRARRSVAILIVRVMVARFPSITTRRIPLNRNIRGSCAFISESAFGLLCSCRISRCMPYDLGRADSVNRRHERQPRSEDTPVHSIEPTADPILRWIRQYCCLSY